MAIFATYNKKEMYLVKWVVCNMLNRVPDIIVSIQTIYYHYYHLLNTYVADSLLGNLCMLSYLITQLSHFTDEGTET